jgi:hypothetical protein
MKLATMFAGVVLVTGSGCGTSSPLSLILTILGGVMNGGGSSNTTTDAVYISVYNFHDNPVRAEVTYRDPNGAQHTQAATTDNGTSPIPSLTRGSLTIAVSDLTTQGDSLINVVLTFPQDGDAEVTIDIRREWMTTGSRARIGVVGPDKDSVGWFIDSSSQ